MNPASRNIPESLKFEVNFFIYSEVSEFLVTFFPSNASINVMVFSVEPSKMYNPLNEKRMNLISGTSSMLKMLKGFYKTHQN